jgi:hypothetical protein
MTIFSMPRPLFDGIMFLTAYDDDFILKCEWLHISGGSMWKCLPVEDESTPWHTTYTTCAAHYHVYTEKHENQFPNYADYPRDMHKFEERWKLRHYVIVQLKMKHTRFEWMTTLHKPKYAKKNRFCMEINRV